MRISVYSRGAIEALAPPDCPHAVISITSAESDVARIPRSAHLRAVLRLSFADADQASSTIPSSALFTPEMARQVWSFVLAHRDAIDELRLHCDAGQCRSPAVAAAISKILFGDDEAFFRRYRPNRLVFRTMLEVWHAEHATAEEPGGAPGAPPASPSKEPSST